MDKHIQEIVTAISERRLDENEGRKLISQLISLHIKIGRATSEKTQITISYQGASGGAGGGGVALKGKALDKAIDKVAAMPEVKRRGRPPKYANGGKK